MYAPGTVGMPRELLIQSGGPPRKNTACLSLFFRSTSGLGFLFYYATYFSHHKPLKVKYNTYF